MVLNHLARGTATQFATWPDDGGGRLEEEHRFRRWVDAPSPRHVRVVSSRRPRSCSAGRRQQSASCHSIGFRPSVAGSIDIVRRQSPQIVAGAGSHRRQPLVAHPGPHGWRLSGRQRPATSVIITPPGGWPDVRIRRAPGPRHAIARSPPASRSAIHEAVNYVVVHAHSGPVLPAVSIPPGPW